MHQNLKLLQESLPANESAAVFAWASTFYPFQQEWLLDWRRYAANLKARQIGASHTFPAKIALHALLGENGTMVSIREEEAIDLLGIARRHCQILAELGSDWAKIERDRAQEIILASGAKIRSTTSKAAGRGFSGNVFLDEFAYHERPQDVWDAALAATTHGYFARVSSTPNGVGNLFHQLCEEIAHNDPSNPEGWITYRTTIDQAMEDGMSFDRDALWDAAMHDERVYDQLYRCKFLDGDLQYIPTALIHQAMTDDEPDRYAETYAGLDIGEKRDRTVLLILQGSPKAGYQVSHCESHKRTDDELLSKLIREAFGTHKCTRVALDGTGMGTFPANKARREFGPKLEPVYFTGKVKESMAGRLYQTFADGTIRLPRKLHQAGEADGIRDDIASIRRIVTPAGNIRFDAPRTAKGHADRAWALMLALHATNGSVARSAFADMYAGQGSLGERSNVISL